MKSERTSRFSSTRPDPVPPQSEEMLVTDVRSGLTPAQMVERKLFSLLLSTPLPVSGLRATAIRRPLA